MDFQSRVYMVESYFMWLRVTELEEDRIISCHLTPRYDRDFNVPVGFDEFEKWYECVYRYKKPTVRVTVNGDCISYGNNSAYVIVEATSTYEAVEKAIKIFQTEVKHRY